MLSELVEPVQYHLPIGDQSIPLNSLIGQRLQFHYDGRINCIYCDRVTNKSFNQGYCYPCMRALARCDICIVRPEKCHFEQGTCREPEWAESHCMQDHYIYLANTSGLKVGITRGSQIPTRWIDQGASQAIPIFRVRNRAQSGAVEVLFKAHVADRTDWRRMLRGAPEALDMMARRDALLAECEGELKLLDEQFGQGAIERLQDAEVVSLVYPVQEYPEKVKALNFDKTPKIEGVLLGIKGQYLILDTGVLNIRKFAGYHVTLGS
ncbi:MAG: DUF2797 domain-containing protein [Gammaproteobacteria bacterium]|nr:DUF2797 domain-containing protein [Gammaproteobacteria bacterium]